MERFAVEQAGVSTVVGEVLAEVSLGGLLVVVVFGPGVLEGAAVAEGWLVVLVEAAEEGWEAALWRACEPQAARRLLASTTRPVPRAVCLRTVLAGQLLRCLAASRSFEVATAP